MTKAALALHYQNDVLHPDGKIALGLAKQPDKRDALIAGAQAFLRAARRMEMPIIHVVIRFAEDGSDIVQNNALFKGVYEAQAMREGSWGAQFYEGLGPEEGERVVRHTRVSAFYGSYLDAVLAGMGAETLYLGGIATNSVVEHTARDGADRGFVVSAVEQACATARDDLHVAALENIRLIGSVVSVSDFETL
ncbi:MAG: isochorismatase family cysteine hydrolase [Pseudomonadota bacterium]